MSFFRFYWAGLQEIPGWVRWRWDMCHCIVCGRRDLLLRSGVHWKCERELLS